VGTANVSSWRFAAELAAKVGCCLVREHCASTDTSNACISNGIHSPEIKFVISSQKEISPMALVTVTAILGVLMMSCLFGQDSAPPKRLEVASAAKDT
jgi:hypothetical protein